MRALIRYPGRAGAYEQIAKTIREAHFAYYGQRAARNMIIRYGGRQQYPWGFEEVAREPDATRPAVAWLTSGGNSLVAAVDGADLVVEVVGRRHGIPWWVLDGAVEISSGRVEEMDSHAPSAPPWVAGVEPASPVPAEARLD